MEEKFHDQGMPKIANRADRSTSTRSNVRHSSAEASRSDAVFVFAGLLNCIASAIGASKEKLTIEARAILAAIFAYCLFNIAHPRRIRGAAPVRGQGIFLRKAGI